MYLCINAKSVNLRARDAAVGILFYSNWFSCRRSPPSRLAIQTGGRKRRQSWWGVFRLIHTYTVSLSPSRYTHPPPWCTSHVPCKTLLPTQKPSVAVRQTEQEQTRPESFEKHKNGRRPVAALYTRTAPTSSYSSSFSEHSRSILPIRISCAWTTLYLQSGQNLQNAPARTRTHKTQRTRRRNPKYNERPDTKALLSTYVLLYIPGVVKKESEQQSYVHSSSTT